LALVVPLGFGVAAGGKVPEAGDATCSARAAVAKTNGNAHRSDRAQTHKAPPTLNIWVGSSEVFVIVCPCAEQLTAISRVVQQIYFYPTATVACMPVLGFGVVHLVAFAAWRMHPRVIEWF
jgi:hypothetical protein